MQGKIYKIVEILGRMNSRTVMMERFQDAEFSWHCCPQKTVMIPRSVCVLYLLFTQPSLIRSFHSSDPCFSVSCPKGVGYARVYCTINQELQNDQRTFASMQWKLLHRTLLVLPTLFGECSSAWRKRRRAPSDSDMMGGLPSFPCLAHNHA